MFSIGQVETTDDEAPRVSDWNQEFKSCDFLTQLMSFPKMTEGFMRGEADRRGVTFTVVGETSHAEDDDHHHHRTDPENRDAIQ